MFVTVGSDEQQDDGKQRVIIINQTHTRLKNPLDINETMQLVESAGAEVLSVLTATRDKPQTATFIGSGKISDLKDKIKEEGANLVIVNHSITPSQERNLSRAIDCQVLDRTRLILDIFAQRAKTHEGKLQVELAQLNHLSTRLIKGWTHLERQKGGIGLRGPGETQLETDRRLIGQRIRVLKKRLDSVEKQRKLHRRARDKVPVPVITLVGYTNAGKSTLFNRLVDEKVYAANQLFATLDPTMRRLEIKDFGSIVLSDTVGFIQDLPHTLVAAFHSTLEEVKNSSILLHVIDASHPEYLSHIDEVNQVLSEIEADSIPLIKVFNKIDIAGEKPTLFHSIKQDETLNEQTEYSVSISAQENLGMDLLHEALYKLLTLNHAQYEITLDNTQEKLRSQIRSRCQVLNECFNDLGDATLTLQLSQKELGWLNKVSEVKPVLIRS